MTSHKKHEKKEVPPVDVALQAPPPPTQDESQLTAEGIKDQVQLIQRVMKAVMKEGEHYGRIPGYSNKPSLLKAGAEKLAHTFRFAPHYVELPGSKEDDDFLSYKVRCDLTHIPTGHFVGSGIGTCNSRERKYRKLEPWDVQNTLYKMACKRALVAAVLNATAASDIFTQDLEDLSEGASERSAAEAASDKPIGSSEMPEIVAQFLSVNEALARLHGSEAYKRFLRNARGESPTIEQIRTWRTPKQLAWLRTVTEAIEERILRQEGEESFG